MEIRINDQAADITLEDEKTFGEVILGFENWFSNRGFRISGINIDGIPLTLEDLDNVFSREIKTINTLDLYTSSISELTEECLINLISDIDKFEKLDFQDKSKFFNAWNDTAQAIYLEDQMRDLYNFYVSLFTGGEMSPQMVYSITEERLREVREPYSELSNLKPLIDETCARLTDLPLDIQTGKDEKAARTIQFFSGVSEKIIRIYRQLDAQGLLNEKLDGEKPFKIIYDDFVNSVNDLLEAYQKNDTVLVGDLCEYELAPKLNNLYDSILNNKIKAEDKK
ncbi:MAG: hypothetical protein LBU66_00410 [Treponema sp.]|jgi:hypothetical protein|nr:hypothetical protein [Treponema sp.]